MNSRLGIIRKQQEDAMHWYHLRNATQVSTSHLSPPHHKREVKTCSKGLKYNEPVSSRYVNLNISVVEGQIYIFKNISAGLRCRGFRKVPNSASLRVSRLYFRYMLLLLIQVKVKKNDKHFTCSQGNGRSKYFIMYQSAV
jgi:hypothetical protein